MASMASWQRPPMPSHIGVTDRVRPGSLALQFDLPAQEYLQSVYVENRLHEQTRWRGQALGMAPTDAMAIQDLVSRLRPGRIVVTNGPPGLCLFLDDLLRLLALPASRILAVGEALEPVPDQVVAVPGPARGAAALAAVERAVAAADMVLVLFAPDPGDHLPVDGLRAYAGFVTPRSYLVFLGTAFGQPWLGYSKQWRMTAIRRLLDWAPFSIDTGCNPHLVSTSPCGYLQRIEEPPHLAAQRLAEDDAVSGDEETGHGR
jgi:cephalosporin hydroxylase